MEAQENPEPTTPIVNRLGGYLSLIFILVLFAAVLVQPVFWLRSTQVANKAAAVHRLSLPQVTLVSQSVHTLTATWPRVERAQRYELTVTLPVAKAPVVQQLVTQDTEVKVRNLLPDTSYRLTVRALPASGGQDPDDAAYAKSVASVPLLVRTDALPATPKKPKTKVGRTSIKLTWEPVATADHYQIVVQHKTRKGPYGKATVIESEQPKVTIKKLRPYTDYRIRVSSLRGVLQSTSSSSLKVTTKSDVEFPYRQGMRGAEIANLQKRLTWLGFPVDQTGTYNEKTATQVRHFQEKYLFWQSGELTEDQWWRLQQVTDHRKRLPDQCRDTSVELMYCVDKTEKLTRQIRYGKVVDQVDVRTARAGKSTPVGMFHITNMHRDWVSTTYNVPMPFFMVFYSSSGGRIGFHYSDSFANNGYYGGSAGCVNIRDRGTIVRWFEETNLGTPVYVYE